MLVGKIQYGDWKDGSAIYKDSKGYYIVKSSVKGVLSKKHLKSWKPKADAVFLCVKNNKWKTCKNKKVLNKTRKK